MFNPFINLTNLSDEELLEKRQVFLKKLNLIQNRNVQNQIIMMINQIEQEIQERREIEKFKNDDEDEFDDSLSIG
tara:strand:+ start:27793 stop:28017 length:225 start_codon:yes stop_codon:yes gene_type:complete